MDVGMCEVAGEIIYYLIGDFVYTVVGRSLAELNKAKPTSIGQKERSEFLPNVSVWAKSRRLLQLYFTTVKSPQRRAGIWVEEVQPNEPAIPCCARVSNEW